jgi:hypothetical protein
MFMEQQVPKNLEPTLVVNNKNNKIIYNIMSDKSLPVPVPVDTIHKETDPVVQPSPKSVWDYWTSPPKTLWEFIAGGTAAYGTIMVVFGPEPLTKLVGVSLLGATLWAAKNTGDLPLVTTAITVMANPRAFFEMSSSVAGAAARQAIQLTGSISGAIVTASGALVGFVLLNKRPKK